MELGYIVLYCVNNLTSKGHLRISWLKPYLNLSLALEFLILLLQTAGDI